jgi:hypothetical protein
MDNKTMGEALMWLLGSRRFVLLILDCVISLILYFVSKYAGGSLEDVKYVIASLQPIFLMMIYAITKDNNIPPITETTIKK